MVDSSVEAKPGSTSPKVRTSSVLSGNLKLSILTEIAGDAASRGTKAGMAEVVKYGLLADDLLFKS